MICYSHNALFAMPIKDENDIRGTKGYYQTRHCNMVAHGPCTISCKRRNAPFAMSFHKNKNILAIQAESVYSQRLFPCELWVTSDLYENGKLILFRTWIKRGSLPVDIMVKICSMLYHSTYKI